MADKNVSKLKNPQKLYYTKKYEKQHQEYPGIESKMHPLPDCGEESYVGHGLLEGRKALVTGGDSGIGRAAAIAYAREGADVAINYHPDEQSDAEDVKKLIEAEGRRAFLIPGDLSKEKFCQKLVKEAVKKLGGLDILTFVAGMQQNQKSLDDISTEQLVKTFEINVFSLFWTIKEALPHMPAGSSITTTTSIQAFTPSKILLDYASTKSAIVAFTKALSKNIADKGIRVNAVAPGPIWTPLQVSGGQPTEKLPEFGQQTSFKRAGQPVELAHVYVLLASEQSSFITGEVYAVSGGLTPY